MPVCLITGASGFLGRHLRSSLLSEWPSDPVVIAVGRTCPVDFSVSSFRLVDLEDRDGLKRLMTEVAPSTVFHLAGRTPPGLPADYYRQNTMATVNLLDSLRGSDRPCRVILVGSAAELGPVAVESLPVGEEYRCQPVDPYGLSKWLATCAGLAAVSPLEVIVARIFNPIGPGLPASQALGRFAGLLADGSGPVKLVVGDLDARRDFVDVRDIASGLVGLARRGQPGEVYHLGTGQSHAVREGLDRLIALSGREVTFEVAPELARNRGPADSRADVRKIGRDVGWSPRISWDQSLIDLWEEAIGRFRAGLTDLRPLV